MAGQQGNAGMLRSGGGDGAGRDPGHGAWAGGPTHADRPAGRHHLRWEGLLLARAVGRHRGCALQVRPQAETPQVQ
eukprot:93960-Lingulodinium_polyedra.AAC.1